MKLWRQCARSLLPGGLDAFALLMIAVLVWKAYPLTWDPGLGWHLKNGEWIIAHGQLPENDPFLFPPIAARWINDQWLADVLLWKAFSWKSWPMLHILTIGLALLPWCLIQPAILRFNRVRPGVALSVVVLCGLMGSLQWITRPVLFSFLLFALVLGYVQGPGRCRLRAIDFVILPVGFGCWANLHPAFVLGLAVVWCWALASCGKGESRQPVGRWFVLLLALLCTGATLVNPLGSSLYDSLLLLGGDRYFATLNVEWRSPDFQNALFWPFGVSVLLCAFLGMRGVRARLNTLDIVLVLGFAAASMLHRRLIPFFSLTVALPLSQLLEAALVDWQQGWGRRVGYVTLKNLLTLPAEHLQPKLWLGVWFLMVCFVVARGHLPGLSLADSSPEALYPEAAVRAIREQGGGGAVWSSPNYGGYIIQHLWPGKYPVIDDRNQLNGSVRYRDFFAVRDLQGDWQAVLERYQASWALVEPDWPLTCELRHSSQWRLVYADGRALVFERIG